MVRGDIAGLFKQFGADPKQYQEIGYASEASKARERWLFFETISTLPQVVPSVKYPSHCLHLPAEAGIQPVTTQL